MSITVDIEKKLGSFTLRTAFEAGNEVLSLLGASGCGKSMTLKCIAGIEKPDRGRIILDGVTLFDSDKKINLSPQKRRTGLMFQNYALFPNMTVFGNIKAGALNEKDPARREKSIVQAMEMFGLTELAGHYPSQLSGGQQQRTALARLLVSSPNILLLDEPFSALDSHLRFRLEEEMRQVIKRFGKSVIMVSHDRDEVFRMSDSIAVMQNGHIEVQGSRSRVFQNPATRNAAILTGCKNISRLQPLSGGSALASDWGMELRLSEDCGGRSYLGIRMHDLEYGDGENSFECSVVEEIENPFSYTIMLRPKASPGASPIGWETDKTTWEKLRGSSIRIRLPKEKILVLEE